VESAGREDPRRVGVASVPHSRLDLSDEGAVRSFLRDCKADAWVNFVARTDVDGCERERPPEDQDPSLGHGPGSAWTMNAALPGWLAEEAERAGRFLVHFSTDYVFDGARGPYPEATPPSPLSAQVSWYGYTKGVGEAAVFASSAPRAIVRIAHPFGSEIPGRTDLALSLLGHRREGSVFPLYTDQQITPTWIPDVAEALAVILDRVSPRIFHVASPEVTTPFEFARTLFAAGGWRTDDLRIASLASSNPAPGKAPRPLRGGLLINDIHKLDVRPRSFREGIRSLLESCPSAIAPASFNR
jgi:dTDP-4-dehydrorhamnose reductase